jgi:DNA-binding transcriptional regulator YhcF (GntR family)
MALDPDDPRPPYQQVANALRAAILTKGFQPGEQLPSGAHLAEQYGVARMTIQRALQILRDEGLVVSRQGSGVFVRERTSRPVALRPHIEQAFTESRVTIDFAGFSGETLHGALQEPLDKVRVGRYTPDSIRVRVIVPDTTIPWALPSSADDLSDDPDFRARARGITTRHTDAIVDAVHELADLGLVANASAEIRTHGTVQLFKLYVINGKEGFFGFYPIVERTVTIKGAPHNVFDLMGKDTVLFHHAKSADDEDTGSQYVSQALSWFESLWSTIGRRPA